MVYSLSAWLVWGVPLAGSLVMPLAGKKARIRDAIAVVPSLISAILATTLLPAALQGATIDSRVPWFNGIHAGVLIDPLSVIMGIAVAWVSFLIMVYSVDYMKGDEGIVRYWFFMNFFIGSMLLIVFSDNLLQLFFGWEGVGLCSYALIGHYYTDEKDKWVGRQGDNVLGVPHAYSPTHAGMKAFITTRFADLFMLAGIFLIYFYSHTFNYLLLASNTAWASQLHASGLLLPAMIFLLFGAFGKSAQFPFQEWLPDAMAGPTPVSALIHAATMVKAGVFFVARIAPIFLLLPYAEKYGFFGFLAIIGAITAFLAASQGLVNKELKKVLAYSTVSQIGYMMLALGVAGLIPNFVQAYSASLFQLISHMLFKAGLFMGAGVLIHMVNSFSLDDMGGLRKVARNTYFVFTVLALSLAGMPPLSGFFSKDAIFASALASTSLLVQIVYIIASLTAIMTAFYSIRMVGLAFLGEAKHVEHNDAGLRQFSTYAVLAVATVVIGVVAPYFEDFLDTSLRASVSGFGISLPPISFGIEPVALVTSLSVLAVGVGLSYPFYISRSIDAAAVIAKGRAKSLHSFLWDRLFINAILYRLFVGPTIAASLAGYRNIETNFFQRLNSAFYTVSIDVAGASDWFDRNVVDGFINGVGIIASIFSKLVRRLQTGLAETYLFAIVVGLLFIFLLLLISIGVV